ncbi:MAG: hypothetical protein GQ561_07795 [Calditrichae bacterium]|nr:hypothetical protein [Calditrichia bacterium]
MSTTILIFTIRFLGTGRQRGFTALIDGRKARRLPKLQIPFAHNSFSARNYETTCPACPVARWAGAARREQSPSPISHKNYKPLDFFGIRA